MDSTASATSAINTSAVAAVVNSEGTVSIMALNITLDARCSSELTVQVGKKNVYFNFNFNFNSF